MSDKQILTIYLSGGLIQSVCSNDKVDPDLKVVICDYDVNDCDCDTTDKDGDICNIYTDCVYKLQPEDEEFFDNFIENES